MCCRPISGRGPTAAWSRRHSPARGCRTGRRMCVRRPRAAGTRAGSWSRAWSAGQTLSGSSPQSEAPALKAASRGRTKSTMDFEEEDFAAAPAPAARGMAKPTRSPNAAAKERVGDAADGGGDARAWFPEAFLWAPDVVTDENGEARVAVTVPDTLTTWRVLALAHVAEGGQAGAVHSFGGSADLRRRDRAQGVDRGDRRPARAGGARRGRSAELWAGRDGSWCGGLTRCVAVPGLRRAGGVLRHPGRATRFARHRGATDGQDTVVRRAMVRPAGRAVHHAGGG